MSKKNIYYNNIMLTFFTFVDGQFFFKRSCNYFIIKEYRSIIVNKLMRFTPTNNVLVFINYLLLLNDLSKFGLLKINAKKKNMR